MRLRYPHELENTAVVGEQRHELVYYGRGTVKQKIRKMLRDRQVQGATDFIERDVETHSAMEHPESGRPERTGACGGPGGGGEGEQEK